VGVGRRMAPLHRCNRGRAEVERSIMCAPMTIALTGLVGESLGIVVLSGWGHWTGAVLAREFWGLATILTPEAHLVTGCRFRLGRLGGIEG